MTHAIRILGLLALAATLSGCGGNTNSLPREAGSPEYNQKTGEMVKNMYGLPSPEKSTAATPADMMRKTYGK